MAAAPQPFIMTSVIPVGPRNTRMVCPSCHSTIVTKVKSSPGVKAWISGLVLAMVGCVLGCCLIPCCMKSCMVKEHSCPNCHTYIGRYYP